MMPARYNVKSAAQFLGVSVSYLYSLIETNKIPYHRFGRKKIVFDEHDLNAYWSGHRVVKSSDLKRLMRSKKSRGIKHVSAPAGN